MAPKPSEATVLDQHQTFRGRTYGEWFCDFWNYVIAIDPDTYEELNQSSPLVFCRGGANMYHQKGALLMVGKRKLSISEGQGIFVAIMPTVADNANTPNCDTEEKRRAFVRRATDESQKPDEMIFKIDGEDKKFQRIETPPFQLNVPDTPYPVTGERKLLKDYVDLLTIPGTHDAVADGYVAIITFSGPGQHTLYFKAGGRYGYMVEALYEIDVGRGGESIVGPLKREVVVRGDETYKKLKRMQKELGLTDDELEEWAKNLDGEDWSFEWRKTPRP
jgi:hypothetical protein